MSGIIHLWIGPFFVITIEALCFFVVVMGGLKTATGKKRESYSAHSIKSIVRFTLNHALLSRFFQFSQANGPSAIIIKVIVWHPHIIYMVEHVGFNETEYWEMHAQRACTSPMGYFGTISGISATY